MAVFTIPSDITTDAGRRQWIAQISSGDDKLNDFLQDVYDMSPSKPNAIAEIITAVQAANDSNNLGTNLDFVFDVSLGPTVHKKREIQPIQVFNTFYIGDMLLRNDGYPKSMNSHAWEAAARKHAITPLDGSSKILYGANTPQGDILLAYNAASYYTSARKFLYVSDLQVGQQLTRQQMYSLGFGDEDLGKGQKFVITAYQWKASDKNYGVTRYYPGGIWSNENDKSLVKGVNVEFGILEDTMSQGFLSADGTWITPEYQPVWEVNNDISARNDRYWQNYLWQCQNPEPTLNNYSLYKPLTFSFTMASGEVSTKTYDISIPDFQSWMNDYTDWAGKRAFFDYANALTGSIGTSY